MRIRLCGAIAAVAVLVAVAATAGPANAASCPWMNTSLSPNQRAQLLLGAMSLSDKIAMTYQQYPMDYHYGAAGYIPGNTSLCIPDLVFNDAGQGVGDAQTGTTAFPAPIAQAASWDPSLQYQFGAARTGGPGQGNRCAACTRNGNGSGSHERAQLGVHGRGPVPGWARRPAETAGIQSQHVIVTLKHYIANSQETNRMTDSSDVDQRTLEEIYAPQYDTAIHQGGAMGVMCSYNRINSVYSCENPNTLKGILDGQFGFTGFVVSDWGATRSTVASALNGLDIEMNVTPGTYYGPSLQTAVEDGQVPMSTLNDMVLRILRAMFTVGVFDHPPAAEPQAFAAPATTPDHVALAREVSEQGTVLLKNQDAILPLSRPGQTIAVLGPDAGQAGAEDEYNGEGSGHVPEAGIALVVSPLQGITQRAVGNGDKVLYADGSATADAVAAAKAADVAVVVAGDSESEGTDRSNLTLTGGICTLAGCTPQTVDQNSLISQVAAANPNTIVVLDTGGPVLMPWLDQIKGLLEAWYPGQEDGNALAALLFGDADPSGHLTETFPASMSDLPIQSASQWPGVTESGDSVGPHSSYSEGLLVGYRWYQARGITPLFPFGFGLSYISFRFSNLTVTSTSSGAVARFNVQNTGLRAGAEVAQAYVGMPSSTGEPPNQLKGFQKVWLEPGQTKTVSITLPETSFAWWNTAGEQWVVTPGNYTVSVGDSSASLPLHATLSRTAAQLPAGAY